MEYKSDSNFEWRKSLSKNPYELTRCVKSTFLNGGEEILM